ncbi:MAG TPA: class I SAM-dependent methyltransferase [Gammaproteobacteria bacterium]|nr:class I SAM-dependent methyltransferase [Gammaproteobacteria bacterium]
MGSGKKNKRAKNKPTQASRADRHKLYEASVQCVESEIDFVDETFTKIRSRQAIDLREDFCGTANTSCEWVRRRKTNKATSIDLDPEVLEWGKSHNLASLDGQQAGRITLINDDVMNVNGQSNDIVLAMNFSYWIFKQRKKMIDYFRSVYNNLKDDGIFFLDSFGGYEAFQEMEEETNYGKFTYVWDQASYNPITGDCTCKIHYKFRDGSRMKDAFVYHWRIWTLPELTEMLAEAGFTPTVYWEGTDKDGEGNGVFTPSLVGEADAGWIVYIVAEK